MRLRRMVCVGIFTLTIVSSVEAQDVNFRATAPSRRSAYDDSIPITLGRPQAIRASSVGVPVYRAQMAETTPPINVPPPPAFPGGAGAVPPTFPGQPATVGGPMRPNEEAYNCGRVNNDADTGSFFTRTGDKLSRCWYDVTDGVSGAFSGGTGRSAFQSDHSFDGFISPVTNPHFFEDPRALTEIRPIFMWQRTPNSNYVFQGDSNYFTTLQARLAITQNISFVINRLGWAWTDVANPIQGVQSGSGFSELHFGPKFTFLREESTNSVAAFGLNFELPIGAASVMQNTGNLSLSPYFSYARNFGRSDYGSFNFMNTTGYSLAVDSTRTDFFYASFHFDYDVGNAKVFYPLVEVNWTYYTFNGSARDVGFEGNNLFNFGSAGVAGHSDLNLALGFRYKFNENVQFGLAGEMNVLGASRHLDLFRLTADMIFRY